MDSLADSLALCGTIPMAADADKGTNLLASNTRPFLMSDMCTASLAPSDVASPEELVFGDRSSKHSGARDPPAGAGDPTMLISPTSNSSASSSQDLERDEKKRKNAAAAAKWREKKKMREESIVQRQEELERTQAMLVAENMSLKAQNQTLQSQLSFFQNLFSSTLQRTSSRNEEDDSLPMYESARNHDSDELEPNNILLSNSNCTAFLPSSSDCKGFACQAVVLLAVLSMDWQDFGDTSVSVLFSPCKGSVSEATGSHHHAGRTLLSLDDVSSAQHGMASCGKNNFWASSSWPFVTFAGVVALQLGAMLLVVRLLARWTIGFAAQTLPAMQHKLCTAAIELACSKSKDPIIRAPSQQGSRANLQHRFKIWLSRRNRE